MTSPNPQPVDAALVPRFGSIPTFMRLPHQPDPAGLDIALIGVPWDGGTTNRAGARHGPREIRNMSSFMRRVHHVYAKVHAAGTLPLSAGGDHLVTLPIFRAIAKGRPLGMVHVDAHSDTNDHYFGGNKYTHGTPFRRAVEEGLLDPKRVIQIGIRGSIYATDDMDFAEGSGMRVVYMEEFAKLGVEKIVAEARRIAGDGPCYISFDVDGLDPVYAPGTGTPEIGGLTTLEAQHLIRGLQGLNLIGGDVVEVAPPFDPSGNTALVGATMMFEILCLLAKAVAERRGG
jgi:guanidinopropionase